MKNTILKLMLTLGIIAFATSMLAVSCGKVAGGGGNNNTANTNTNSGSGGSGGSGNGGSGGEPTCTGICPSATLTLGDNVGRNWVKISGNTVTINAAGMTGGTTPLSDTDPNNRGFDDALTASRNVNLFQVEYPGATAVMFFVNRASVSTNNITVPATVAACSSSETDDNAFATAASGSLCRRYATGRDRVNFHNYLGAVFNNTDTANHARGIMQCFSDLTSQDAIAGNNRVISDTVAFNRTSAVDCNMAVVNNGLGTGVEIDDAWVGDADSTTEVELHAIGINVSGKTIPQFSSDAGYNLAEFIKAQDNAAFKRLLQKNPWGELKFKVKIVKSSDF